MRGKDKGHAVEFLGQEAGHRHVPGMGVDDVDSFQSLDLRQVEAESLQGPLELAFGPVGNLAPGFCAADVQVAVVGMLRPPAVHFYLDILGQLAAQIIHMDSSPPIHMRGVFACE
jgi:hypothetical protein